MTDYLDTIPESDAEKALFYIGDDKAADWALKKIKEEEDELARLKKLADEEISEIEYRFDMEQQKMLSRTAFLRGRLAMYFDTVEHKETKTQETYKLLNGTIFRKKAATAIDYDPKNKEQKEALVKYLQESKQDELVKTEYSPMWAELKKQLSIDGEKVVNVVTGEIVPLGIKETPAEFGIKW